MLITCIWPKWIPNGNSFYLRIESYFSAFHEMSGKLHLICMKTEVFMLKLDVIFPTLHTLVKRRKIISNSYNYNFFFILSYSVFIIMFS